MQIQAEQYIWIDQMSINQSNTIQRNHQVHLMSNIYSDSESVIIWLGDGSKQHRSGTTYEAALQFYETCDPESLATILHEDYFGRLRVVQEVLLARAIRVLIKNIWLSWDHMRIVSRRHRFFSSGLKSAHHILQLADRRSWSQHGLMQAVELFSCNHCVDLRDKVYGLMGLVSPEDRLTIDYGKPVQIVYIEVVLSITSTFLERIGNGLVMVEDDTSLLDSFSIYQKIFAEPSQQMQVKMPERGEIVNLVRTVQEKLISDGTQCSEFRSGCTPAQSPSDRHEWWYEINGNRQYADKIVRESRSPVGKIVTATTWH